MKRVSLIQTIDGDFHQDIPSAQRHAEKRYGEALSKVAAQMVHCDKYTKLQDYIDSNLEKFIELKALKNDIKLEDEGREEWLS